MATRDDLIRLTLEKLVVVGVGETASAEDVATVGPRVDGVLRNLARRGVIVIANIDQIPSEVMDDLAEIARNMCANSYGQEPSKQAVLDAEDRLREMDVGDGAGRETIWMRFY